MKFRNAAIALVLSVALAACGGAPPAAAPSAPADAPAASAEQVTVTVMTWEGAETNAAIDEALARFEAEHPAINVERVPSPASNYGDKLQSMVLADELPDIFWAGNDTAHQFGDQGLLYDWRTMAQGAANGGIDLEAFAPAAIENWSGASGELYGLPTLMNAYGIWYNADLFEAAGVPLPKPGWTYDELLAAAAALTVKEGEQVSRYGLYATGNESIYSPWTVSNCAVSAGGQPFMDKIINPTKVTADEQFMACAEQLAEAVQAGYITPPGYPGDGLTESFIAGQVPMLYFGQWLAPSFLTAEPAFTYGFAPLPIVRDPVQPYDAVGIAAPRGIENPEAVWEVMQFLASGAWETVLVGAPVAPAAHVPSSSPYFNRLGEVGLTAVAEGVRYELEAPVKQGIRFTAPWSAKANDVVASNWNAVLTGEKQLRPTVTAMVEQINGIIAAGQ